MHVFVPSRSMHRKWLGVTLEEPCALKASRSMISFVAKAAVLLFWVVLVGVRLGASRAAALGAPGAGLGGWVVEHGFVGLWLPPRSFVAALTIGHLARRLA